MNPVFISNSFNAQNPLQEPLHFRVKVSDLTKTPRYDAFAGLG